jgi:hypothetical protein
VWGGVNAFGTGRDIGRDANRDATAISSANRDAACKSNANRDATANFDPFGCCSLTGRNGPGCYLG